MFVGSEARAALEGTILKVTSPLRMTSGGPAAPKDYFIDLGRQRGVKPGDVFTVYRALAVLDGQTGEPKDSMKIGLGELQIQAVGDYSSFGRLLRSTDPKEMPAMDSPWFMVGDTVQLKVSLPFQQ